MSENRVNGDRFSPQVSEVPEVTEVLEVAETVNQDGVVEAAVSEEEIAFTPMAASAPTPPSFQASNPEVVAEEAYRQPKVSYPEPSPYPAPTPFSQSNTYPQGGQPAYAPPAGAYPNSGQPFESAQGAGGVFIEEVPWSDKSKLAAGLFGILLGTFGVHNFYLGFIGKAVAQLLLTVLSFGMLSWVSGIWGLVEGILVLAAPVGTRWDLDGQGLPMRPISASGA